jgi:hypothetical protein
MLKTSLAGAIAVFSVASCDLTKDVSPDSSAEDQEDTEIVSMDVLDDYYFEDADDLASTAIDEEFNNSGKAAGDGRFACATVTRTGDDNKGTIQIDFGAGCNDNNGRNRRGAILIEYSGRPAVKGSLWKHTFVNYFVNDVNLTGTRTVTVTGVDGDVVSTDIVVTDAEARFPDGSIARRRLHRHREAHRNNNILDRLIIYGTEEGNHRNGRGFQIEIAEPLVYDRQCGEKVIIPVKGVKLIKHGDREIKVDYGDGTCDNKVTITNKNGRSWEYRLDN